MKWATAPQTPSPLANDLIPQDGGVFSAASKRQVTQEESEGEDELDSDYFIDPSEIMDAATPKASSDIRPSPSTRRRKSKKTPSMSKSISSSRAGSRRLSEMDGELIAQIDEEDGESDGLPLTTRDPNDSTVQALGLPILRSGDSCGSFPYTTKDLERLRKRQDENDILPELESGKRRKICISQGAWMRWEECGGIAEGLGILGGGGYDEDGELYKPAIAVPLLIRLVLAASPRKKLTLNQIYNAIVERWPYFGEDGEASWRNTVRHTLSLGEDFINEDKPTEETYGGKGNYWKIRPGAVLSKFKPKRSKNHENICVANSRKRRSANASVPTTPASSNGELNDQKQDMKTTPKAKAGGGGGGGSVKKRKAGMMEPAIKIELQDGPHQDQHQSLSPPIVFDVLPKFPSPKSTLPALAPPAVINENRPSGKDIRSPRIRASLPPIHQGFGFTFPPDRSNTGVMPPIHQMVESLIPSPRQASRSAGKVPPEQHWRSESIAGHLVQHHRENSQYTDYQPPPPHSLSHRGATAFPPGDLYSGGLISRNPLPPTRHSVAQGIYPPQHQQIHEYHHDHHQQNQQQQQQQKERLYAAQYRGYPRAQFATEYDPPSAAQSQQSRPASMLVEAPPSLSGGMDGYRHLHALPRIKKERRG